MTNTKGWSKERREKQAERCRQTKPWQKATGPTTELGKENCKYNATKHGLYSEEGKLLRHLMFQQSQIVNRIIKQDKIKGQDNI